MTGPLFQVVGAAGLRRAAPSRASGQGSPSGKARRVGEASFMVGLVGDGCSFE
jgi:hypothetical protein